MNARLQAGPAGRAWPAKLPERSRAPLPTETRFVVCQALVLLAMGAATLAQGAGARVFSLNILQDTGAASGSNANVWNYTAGEPRRDRVVRVILEADADLVGLQECEPNQVNDLTGTNALSAYGWYGAGRDDGLSAGTHDGIFYRTNRFTRTAQGVFWLSTTPDTPGSKYSGAAQVRIAVWARLADARTGRSLLVVSTHWDFQSAAAREYSAGLIRSRLLGPPADQAVIVMGDLNGYEDESAFPVLRGTGDPAGVQLVDCYRAMVPVLQTNELTRHNFTGGTSGKRIDFVFASAAFATTNAAIVRTAYNGRYPSDHYPVSAGLSLAPAPPVITGLQPAPEGWSLSWAAVPGLRYPVQASELLQPWSNRLPADAVWTATSAAVTAAVPLAPAGPVQILRVLGTE